MEVILPTLCLIPIAGGLLIMIGQHDRSEALFYHFHLEDQVPESRLLRLIEKNVGFRTGIFPESTKDVGEGWSPMQCCTR